MPKCPNVRHRAWWQELRPPEAAWRTTFGPAFQLLPVAYGAASISGRHTQLAGRDDQWCLDSPWNFLVVFPSCCSNTRSQPARIPHTRSSSNRAMSLRPVRLHAQRSSRTSTLERGQQGAAEGCTQRVQRCADLPRVCMTRAGGHRRLGSCLSRSGGEGCAHGVVTPCRGVHDSLA